MAITKKVAQGFEVESTLFTDDDEERVFIANGLFHPFEEILAEEGVVAVVCEFCGERYRFDARDVHRVVSGDDATLH